MDNKFKIVKVAIIIVAVVDLIAVIIFGVFRLRQKLNGGAVDQASLDQKQNTEIITLNQALDRARSLDKDLDGLTVDQEKQYGTDPEKSDTDGDGMSDKTEITIWKTDPLKADTDGDGKKDGFEVRQGDNPLGAGKIQFNK